MFGFKKFKKEYKVEGMHCAHCSASVENAVKNVEGVKSAKADAKNGSLIVVSSVEIDDAKIAEAVKGAGFEVA